MRAVSGAARAGASQTSRNEFQGTEGNFGSIFSDIARMLWPTNTAAHVAALAGCSTRMVEFYLAGTSEWSGAAIAVVVAEIMRRHGARNLKVKAKR